MTLPASWGVKSDELIVSTDIKEALPVRSGQQSDRIKVSLLYRSSNQQIKGVFSFVHGGGGG